MIRYFDFSSGTLQETSSFAPNCWTYIEAPIPEELAVIDTLARQLNIPADFFSDPLDLDERPRHEYEDNILFILLRIPYLDRESLLVPFSTIPLGIVAVDNYVFTICPKRNKILEDFAQKRELINPIANPLKFVLRIFFKVASLYLRDLKDIYRLSDQIERELHVSIKNKELIKLLDLEKSMVYFTTSLKANEIMMERFLRSTIFKDREPEYEYLEDIIIENKQALETAKIYSDILSGMMDAFASVISNNLNIVMKALTSISIVLMIPTLVASFFGMNVPLPFSTHTHAFLIIFVISAALAVSTILVFIKKHYF